MRHQGKITLWKDGKGFGFITPHSGGNQVFVHIKSFTNRQRRPVGNEIVTYDLKTDARGRTQAGNVAFVAEDSVSDNSPRRGIGSLIFTTSFFVFLAASVIIAKLPLAVFLLYLLASVVTYLAYAFDKSAAIQGQWRIQESTLHLLALAGGWPGALVAQRLLRHKSRKQSFQIVFWVTIAFNCTALSWLFSPAGEQALSSLFAALKGLPGSIPV